MNPPSREQERNTDRQDGKPVSRRPPASPRLTASSAGKSSQNEKIRDGQAHAQAERSTTVRPAQGRTESMLTLWM